MVRHIVALTYRPSATEEQVRRVTEAFRRLQESVPGILSFEQGVNISREGRDHGFTHVNVLTFADEETRDAYLPHPEHRRFIALLDRLQVVDDVLVLDYHPQA